MTSYNYPSANNCLIGIITGPLLLSTLAVQGAATWPTLSSDWTAVTVDGGSSFYHDPDDINPASTDIEGDATYSALYWYYQDNGTPLDDSDDQLQFRVRLDEEPNNPQSVWQILFNVDADLGLDYLLEYDTSGNPDILEFAATDVEGPNVSDVTVDTSHLLWSTNSVASYTRFVNPTGDGSNFGGDNDVFLDMAMPWTEFTSATGITKSDSFQIGVSTSTTDQSINKDVPLGLSASSQVSDLLGDVITVPEPTSSMLFGVAVGLGLFGRRRQKGGRLY